MLCVRVVSEVVLASKVGGCEERNAQGPNFGANLRVSVASPKASDASSFHASSRPCQHDNTAIQGYGDQTERQTSPYVTS